jgi:L-ribulokinase
MATKTNPSQYALGIDYGTNSCRALIVRLSDGKEMGTKVFPYPSGHAGILISPADPNVARQNPQDYIDGLKHSVRGAIAAALEKDADFDAKRIIGIGVDTTGSTPIPVDAHGTPLGLLPRFKDNLNAQVWLWKDHTSYQEASHITETARKMRPQYLAKCGGVYSSEWFWSKILHLKRIDPETYAAAHSFVEHCDYIPALLTGNTKPETLFRGVCAAGHKAFYSEQWGGLPDVDFLEALEPGLGALRSRLFSKAHSADVSAGGLTSEWAERLGLKPGISVCVGAFDAHMGGVGAGISPGTLVKILGTSTCDMMVAPSDKPLKDIPGVCGIVNGSVLPGHFGIEAGQSAVGDIFLWFVNTLVPESYGKTQDEKFVRLAAQASQQKPGAHGLIALDWNNGNRTILVDTQLTGLLIGQTLHTQPHEIYRALIEATAFGALTIINRIEEYGVQVETIVNCGGLADKNELLMQIYADVTGRDMKVSRSDQTCALGAALFAAVSAGKAAGGFATVSEGQKAMCAVREKVFTPIPENHAVYRELYQVYLELHDAFGTENPTRNLSALMKQLIRIRERQRN